MNIRPRHPSSQLPSPNGRKLVREMRRLESQQRHVKDELQTTPEIFDDLVDWLTQYGALCPNKHIEADEKLAITLRILATGCTYRSISTQYGHSTQTIHAAFHDGIRSLLKLHKEMVKMPDSSEPTPWQITSDRRFASYFANCVGVVSGTLIPVWVSDKPSTVWKCRKGFLAQNVFSAIDFNNKFQYALAGWEGSASDETVLTDAFAKGFEIPPGRFYLGHLGFRLRAGVLTPYRGVPYHQHESSVAVDTTATATAYLKPQNAKELFNLKHSQLRSFIERDFGIAKKRFHILQMPHRYNILTQVRIVFAVMALHNFFLMHNDHFRDYTHVKASEPDGDEELEHDLENGGSHDVEDEEMSAFRDGLANRMWADYTSHAQVQ